jgi:hypothetical protein
VELAAEDLVGFIMQTAATLGSLTPAEVVVVVQTDSLPATAGPGLWWFVTPVLFNILLAERLLATATM